MLKNILLETGVEKNAYSDKYSNSGYGSSIDVRRSVSLRRDGGFGKKGVI